MNDGLEVAEAFTAYADYLRSVKGLMPDSAYEFAAAEWHYDFNDHKCPHDSWVEHLNLKERSAGSRSEIRHLDIEVKLLGAYHDKWLYLSYLDVVSYSFHSGNKEGDVGHGDWLIDEVRLSEKRFVIHEVVFDTGAKWIIECGDIRFNCIEKQAEQ
jgi:hypothetical protein